MRTSVQRYVFFRFDFNNGRLIQFNFLGVQFNLIFYRRLSGSTYTYSRLKRRRHPVQHIDADGVFLKLSLRFVLPTSTDVAAEVFGWMASKRLVCGIEL
jgi:hypothetical protein